ncbi:MAG TPA: ABC transporter permease [Microscillaceae bacterium]|nr:ABC transporter permease [Microscillaceae bacterium]
MLRLSWWKYLCLFLLIFTHIAGLLLPVPRMDILNESIRNLYFHVPMWFGMILLLGTSSAYSVGYLRRGSQAQDFWAIETANLGVLMGVLGIVTGMIWANFTWGEPWSDDPKQNASAIGLLIYFAYFILRGSLTDAQQKARISAVYNIFAFAILIPLLFILPRLTDSLHPGNGGNPGFNAYDLDSRMRMVFYPAVIGWFLAGLWVAQLRVRVRKLEAQAEEKLFSNSEVSVPVL